MKTPYVSEVVNDGAVNYWVMDESTGSIYDYFGGTLNFVVSGSITYSEPSLFPGGLGESLYFDGSSTHGSVSITDYRGSDSVGSLEVWLKIPVGHVSRTIMSVEKGNDSTATMVDFKVSSTGTGQLAIYDNNTAVPSLIIIGTIPINDGLPHHLVVTGSGTGTYLYVDGVLDTSVGTTGWFTLMVQETTTRIYVGVRYYNNVYGHSLQGHLSNLAYYPVALTAEQVARHYEVAGISTLPSITYSMTDSITNPFSHDVKTGYQPQAFKDSAISSDGSVLFVSNNEYDNLAGQVLIFDRVNDEWVYRGELPNDVYAAGRQFGSALATNDDGTTIVVRYQTYGITGSTGSAAFRTYDLIDGVWTYRTQFSYTYNSTQNDSYPYLALSGNGNRVVIGNIRTTGYYGTVSVLDRNGSLWQTRSDRLITSSLLNETSGFASGVALNYDGTILAVGAPYLVGYKGSVYVYEEGVEGWTLRDLVIPDSPGTDYKGFRPSLSSTGETLTVSAYQYDQQYANMGGVYICKWDSTFGKYLQASSIINSYSDIGANYYQGLYSSMSADAGTLVIGSHNHDVAWSPTAYATPNFVGKYSEARVYSTSTGSESLSTTDFNTLSGGLTYQDSVGDLAIVIVTSTRGVNSGFSLSSSGWTEVYNGSTGSANENVVVRVYYKVLLTTTESFGFNTGAYTPFHSSLFLFRNHGNQTLSIKAISYNVASGEVPEVPVTTPSDGCYVLAVSAWSHANSVTYANPSTPNAFAETFHSSTNETGYFGLDTKCHLYKVPTAGEFTPDAISGSTDSSHRAIGASIVIEPVAQPSSQQGKLFTFKPISYHVSGTVSDDTGSPAARKIRLHRRDTGAKYAEQMSDGTTGQFDFQVYENTEYTVVCLHNGEGTNRNALVFDGVVPSIVSEV